MKKTLNIRSNQLDNNGLPKSPTESQLLYGEIAINYKKSKETLFIKNDENEIIPFSNDNTIISLIEENSVKESSGVSISQDNDISVKLGEHLEFDENSAITLTIDDNLDSGSTNPIANSAVTQAIFDNEEVVAAALNDLKETKQDTLTAGNGISISNNVVSYTGESQSLSAGSGVNVSNGVINVKLGENLDFDSNSALTLIIDDELDSGSTNPVSNSAVTTAILDNEFVISNALNELRIQKQNVLTAGNGISISNDTISYTGETQNITAGSGLSLNNDVLNIKLGSGISFDANSALTVESASIDIDSELNENSSNPVANSAITQAINGKQDELIASSGITIDANDNISVKLGECLEFDENSGITLIVDDELDSGSTNPIANSAITQAILDNEEVVAAALNDLKETKQDTLTAGNGISISNNVVSYTGQSQSLTAGSGITIDANDNISVKLGEYLDFDENSGITLIIDDELDSGSTNPISNSAITKVIYDNELVISSALNDLNDRENSSERNIEALNTLVNTKQETLVSGTNIKTINGNSILGSGNLVIEGGGSGGDTNVIETVKVNGTPLTPDANKAVDVTVPTALSGLTDDATHRLVTDSEKTAWNSKNEVYIYDIDASNLNEDGEKIVESSVPYTDINAAYQAGKTIYVRLTNNNAFPFILNMISTNGLTEGGYEFTAMVQNGDATFFAHVDIGSTEYYVNCGQKFFLEDEEDPTVPAWAKAATKPTYTANEVGALPNTTVIPTALSALTDDATHRLVTDTEKSTWNGKVDKANAISALSLSLNTTDYKLTLSGTRADGTTFTVSDVVDLPLESVVVGGRYDDTTKKVILTLQNGNTIDFSVADLINGLQSEITSTNKLSADLISDGTTNKTVTATEKSTWNGKQDAITDLSDIRSGAALGATALQSYTETDPTVPSWAKAATKPTYTASEVGALPDTTVIPTALSDLSDDATHRLVTETEKSTWNGKQDALANANILSGITSTNVINWNSAASNSHTHSNKSVLDNLTQSVIDNSHTHANKTVLDGISSTDISNWNSKTDNVGTITGINMNGASKGTSGVVDLGTVITSETQLTKGTTNGTGNAVTDISVSNHQITLTKGSTFLTEHQSLKTLNGTPLGGTGNISLTGVPAFDPVADEGKILGIVNGALAWVSPITIYTGNGTPSDSQGKDGDIYLQTS